MSEKVLGKAGRVVVGGVMIIDINSAHSRHTSSGSFTCSSVWDGTKFQSSLEVYAVVAYICDSSKN